MFEQNLPDSDRYMVEIKINDPKVSHTIMLHLKLHI